jgi:hypothetical protein
VVLFLDFDGVLHPAQGGELFTSLALLEAVLRDAPEVRVVISSSWREIHPLDELREYFSEDLRDRVIGITPLQAPVEAVPEKLAMHRRHAECMAWLANNAHERWLALDDQAFLWSAGCKNLQLVDGRTGLTEADAAALLKKLLESAG